MITEESINGMVDSCIDSLVNDDPKKCAEGMVELCRLYAKAGMPINDWRQTRYMIIKSAEQKTDKLFIKEKLSVIENELAQGRALCH